MPMAVIIVAKLNDMLRSHIQTQAHTTPTAHSAKNLTAKVSQKNSPTVNATGIAVYSSNIAIELVKEEYPPLFNNIASIVVTVNRNSTIKTPPKRAILFAKAV